MGEQNSVMPDLLKKKGNNSIFNFLSYSLSTALTFLKLNSKSHYN